MVPITALQPSLPGLWSTGSGPLTAASQAAGPTTLGGIQMPADLAQAGGVAPAGSSFSSMLGQFVSEVNQQQLAATQTVNAVQSGQNIPLNHAMIAMEEANVSFQLMVEVRNRLLDSYQEIMRMQV